MTCTTHHKACDCREAEFTKLREQNRRLKAAIRRVRNLPQQAFSCFDGFWINGLDVLKAARLRK